MAVKSILEIDVNDGAFRNFMSVFDRYQGELKKMPASWAAAGKEVKTAGGSFREILAALLAQNEIQTHITDGAKRITTSSRETEQHWRGLARSTASVAGNITRATTSLLKWAGITGAVSALVGAGGGLWGIDRLAGAATGGRRSSMGLGITFGEEQSFEANFKRFVNPGALLGGISTGKYNGASDQYLAMAGLGIAPGTIQNKDAADLGVTVLEKIRQRFHNPNQITGAMFDSLHLGALGLSMSDVLRTVGASPEEFKNQIGQYRSGAKSLNMNSDELRKWNDLDTQLDLAGKSIRKTLIDGLTPLTPELKDLSDNFSQAVAAFLGSKDVKKWIGEAAEGLKQFDRYVGTDKFRRDVEDFAKGIGEMAGAVGEALKFLGVIPRDPGAKPGKGPLINNPTGGSAPAYLVGPKWDKWIHDHWNDVLHGDGSPGSGSATPAPAPSSHGGFTGHADKSVYRVPRGGGNAPANTGRFAAIEASYNLPRGLLWNVYGAESSYGRNTSTSSAGAQGPFQFMPGTARQYGLTNPWDTNAAATAAGKYFSKLIREFHGDTAKAVAGYNWGEGNVERDVRRHGESWRRFLPRETKNYLDKVLHGIGNVGPAQPKQPLPSRNPRIEINNNTGGNAYIIASQLVTT